MAWLTMGSNNQARSLCIIPYFVIFCFRDVYSAGREDFENRMVQRISFRESMVKALDVPFISCTPDAFSALRISGFCSNIENLDLLCTDLEVSVSPACATFAGSFCCYISLAQGNSLNAVSTASPNTQSTASTFLTTPIPVPTQQSTSTAGPAQTNGVPSTSASSTPVASTAGLITSTTQRPTTSTLFTPAFPSTTPTVNPATVLQSTTIQSTAASTTQPATVPSTLPPTTITAASTTTGTTPGTSTTARTTLAPTTVTTSLPSTVPTTTIRTNPPTTQAITVTTNPPTTVTTPPPTTIGTNPPTTVTTTVPTTTIVRTNPPTTVTVTTPTTTVRTNPPTTVTTTLPTTTTVPTTTTNPPTTVPITTPTTTIRTNPPTVATTIPSTTATIAQPAAGGDIAADCASPLDPINCPATRDLIIGNLNAIRRAQNAANMLRMEWDPVAAEAAQRWANQCRGTAHNFLFSTTNFDSPNGQNTAVGFGDWTGVLTAWNNEGLTVTVGQPCPTTTPMAEFGHFTQDVWATSFQVGCAFSSCTGRTDINQYVCNFGPGGNVEPAGAPDSQWCVNPYIPGTPQNGGPCGKCGGLSSPTCDRGLCTNPCRFKNSAPTDQCDPRATKNPKSCNPGGSLFLGCKASCNCMGKSIYF